MKLTVKRNPLSSTPYTQGELYIDDEWFCSTIEDKDRGLTQDMSIEEIQSKKIYGETAIPKGTYKVTLDVVSPKFSQYPFYMDVCQGRLPRLLNVPGYEGVLIHVAEGPKADKLVQGCIGVGERAKEGYLIKGKETFMKLYDRLLEDKSNITIEIV